MLTWKGSKISCHSSQKIQNVSSKNENKIKYFISRRNRHLKVKLKWHEWYCIYIYLIDSINQIQAKVLNIHSSV